MGSLVDRIRSLVSILLIIDNKPSIDYERLCYRAYLIYLIPREELEEKLGWDIPPVPEVSIAGINFNSVLLFWINGQESQHGTIKHSVEVNGIKGQYPWNISSVKF